MEVELNGIYRFFLFAVKSISCVWFFVTPWTAACQASLSFTISQSLLRFISIESVMLSNHLILCSPFSFCLQSFPASFPAFFPSNLSHGLFLCVRWPKYCSFSNSPSNEYSRLISFRIDWFDLLGVQRTLKNLLQHHNSKAHLQSLVMSLI